MCTMLGKCHPTCQKIPSLQRKPCAHEAVTLHFSPQPMAAANLFSISMDLPIPDISHKWTHITCSSLCLLFFILQSGIPGSSMLHCGICQHFICASRRFCFKDFVYPVISCWTFGLFLLFNYHE